MTENLQELEDLLGVHFQRKDLLLRALTHSSFLNENREARALGHNERMEFLGDAVLELVVTEYLYRNLPENNEGEMSDIRASLVSGQSLSKIAEDLGIFRFVRMSRGQSNQTQGASRARSVMMEDVLEAIIAAIYLDRGKASAEIFVLETVVPRLEQIQREGTDDWKNKFQIQAHKLNGQTPTYKTIDQTGPDHNRTFTVSVQVGGKTLATASGRSLREAEKEAARKALDLLPQK